LINKYNLNLKNDTTCNPSRQGKLRRICCDEMKRGRELVKDPITTEFKPLATIL